MTTPLLPMYTLGHDFVPARSTPAACATTAWPRWSATSSHEGLVEARAMHQLECYEAAVLFARTEGFIPAPETCHAIAAAIEEANLAKEEGKETVILFNWSGHGLMDLTGYDAYLTGKLRDVALPEEDLAKSLEGLKGLPKAE